MKQSRIDLSTWVLHFIHDRNPDNDAAYNLNEGDMSPPFPYHEDRETNSRFEFWEISDEAFGLAPDDYASSVLRKILEDGHIRSGWSFRNFKPTIYGPRSACCFTEMPLFGLIEYAKRRSKTNVGTYAIGLPRNEFFAAGGRSAIYGLSGEHKELSTRFSEPFRGWPRYLDPACGIGIEEQYRYVTTSLGGQRKIDWTHEREWRWTDREDQYSCPGLPIWLDESHQFSRIMIVVPEKEDARHILDTIKELHDAGSHNYGHEYSRKAFRRTYVVAIEELEAAYTADKLLTLRLEDIPTIHLKEINRPIASDALIDDVRDALATAHQIASTAASTYLASAGRTRDGHVADVCGFSDVVIYEAQSEVVSALLKLDEATVIGGVGYLVSDFGKHGRGSQALSVVEAATEAAADYLNSRFPKAKFSTRSMWD